MKQAKENSLPYTGIEPSTFTLLTRASNTACLSVVRIELTPSRRLPVRRSNTRSFTSIKKMALQSSIIQEMTFKYIRRDMRTNSFPYLITGLDWWLLSLGTHSPRFNPGLGFTPQLHILLPDDPYPIPGIEHITKISIRTSSASGAKYWDTTCPGHDGHCGLLLI